MRNTADRRIELACKLKAYNSIFEDNFHKINEIWKEYFTISLEDIGIKDKQSIDILFTCWEMTNWDAMHRENTKYRFSSRQQMYDAFCSEADYVADRISLDRVFRTHWLFRDIFYDEICESRHPGSTKFKGFIKYWR